MIDIVEIKGKKFIFIDENAFGYPPTSREAQREDEEKPIFYTHFSFSKREKIGERMMY